MLYIVSTPIGNLEDISYRAVRVLTEVDAIVCEDTRETIKLLKHFQIPPKKLISFYEENENIRLTDIISLLDLGENIALTSDGGTPLISDPGYKLVRECLNKQIPVTVIPGPSAVVSALTMSGLPPDKFLFLGFLPEKESHRLALLKNVLQIQEHIKSTIICYVSPHKLSRDLKSLENIFGDIEIVLLRELTKVYEQRWIGKVSEALKVFKHPKGEFVLLFNLKN